MMRPPSLPEIHHRLRLSAIAIVACLLFAGASAASAGSAYWVWSLYDYGRIFQRVSTGAVIDDVETNPQSLKGFGCPPGIRTPIACSRGRCPSR